MTRRGDKVDDAANAQQTSSTSLLRKIEFRGVHSVSRAPHSAACAVHGARCVRHDRSLAYAHLLEVPRRRTLSQRPNPCTL